MEQTKSIVDVITSLPNEDDQKRLIDVINNNKEEVMLRGKAVKIGSLHNGTLEKMSDIIVNEKDDRLMPIKVFAMMRLNGFFKCRLFYWILWRWYAYIKEYSYEELIPIIDMARKKVSGMWVNYVVATTSLTALKTTMMSMNREEANAFHQEQLMAMRGIVEFQRKEVHKSHTSRNQGTSSED